MAPSNGPRQHSLRSKTILNNHTKAQATSLSSPVPRQNAGHVQKPSKEDRRAKIAHAHITDKATSTRAPRIDKNAALPRNHQRSNTTALVQKFDDALSVKQEELAGWAHVHLLDTEEHYQAELDQVADEFGDQLKIISEVEEIMNKPIGHQILAQGSKQDQNGAVQEIGNTLEDCMIENYKIAAQEEENLGALWLEWSEVQAEMICLTVEILGEHNIDVGRHKLSDQLVKSINNADTKYKGNEVCYVEAEQSLDKLGADLISNCSETTKTVKAQQKTWRVERDRMLDNIKQAMADFEKNK